MSNPPNFSPAIAIGFGILGTILSVTIFAYLPSLPQTMQDLSFLFFGFLPLFLSAGATLLSRKIGVTGYFTGVMSVHIGVTLPSAIIVGYYILWLNGSDGLRFLLDILQYGFILAFLVLIMTIVSVLGAMPFTHPQTTDL